jgi:hypothetical protein
VTGDGGFTFSRTNVYQANPTGGDMKKQQTVLKKRLQVSGETLRDLNVSQLKDVAGGTNNGCTHGSALHTACLICEF